MEALILLALGWLFLGAGAKADAETWSTVETGSSLDAEGENLPWKIMKSSQRPKFAAMYSPFAGGWRWFEGGAEYDSEEDATYDLFEAINKGDIRRGA